ncbi:hypothetical protein [Maribacter sp. HTCC2170]|uniref:hypothetical protein n=1 Tax=Maribacter sp. (strain HTCC2170 / KCCM 42371) TaxID=313603 RepID=UPI0005A0A75F|nr:hypothetical protein [Maribacter sp. HTCC2170]
MIRCHKNLIYFLRQKASMLMIAFMLGMSNVILEETRMVNDTRIKTEQLEVLPDEDVMDEVAFLDV